MNALGPDRRYDWSQEFTIRIRSRFTIRSLALLIAFIALSVAILPSPASLGLAFTFVMIFLLWPLNFVRLLLVSALLGVLMGLLLPSITVSAPLIPSAAPVFGSDKAPTASSEGLSDASSLGGAQSSIGGSKAEGSD